MDSEQPMIRKVKDEWEWKRSSYNKEREEQKMKDRPV